MDMKLKTFIAETLNGISDGILDAQKHAKEIGAHVNPPGTYIANGQLMRTEDGDCLGQTIEFDIALTVIQSDQAQGGVGVFSGIISAGAKGQTESIENAVHHVRFSIPVFFPIQ